MQPFWLCQANNGLKSYNEIMEMDRPHTNMPESRTGNREFIWSGLIEHSATLMIYSIIIESS